MCVRDPSSGGVQPTVLVAQRREHAIFLRFSMELRRGKGHREEYLVSQQPYHFDSYIISCKGGRSSWTWSSHCGWSIPSRRGEVAYYSYSLFKLRPAGSIMVLGVWSWSTGPNLLSYTMTCWLWRQLLDLSLAHETPPSFCPRRQLYKTVLGVVSYVACPSNWPGKFIKSFRK